MTQKPRPLHPATVDASRWRPHAATVQRTGASGRPPHAATLQRADASGTPPHPATLQRRMVTDASGRPLHAATIAQMRGAWDVAQRAQQPTMVNLHGAGLAKQDELAWCYASVVSVLTEYLNNGQGWSPCQIASWAVNHNVFADSAGPELLASACNCCKASNKRPENCKGPKAVSKLGPVLDHLNITRTQTKGNLSWQTVTTQVDANQPIVLALVRNDNKPGHVAMIVGYEQVLVKPNRPDLGTTSYVILFDPAAQNTEYAQALDNSTWTMKIAFMDILGSYPMSNGKWSIGYHYSTFAQGQALPAPPNWAVFQ